MFKVRCIDNKKGASNCLKIGQIYTVVTEIIEAIDYNGVTQKNCYLLKNTPEYNGCFPYMWDKSRFVLVGG